MCVLFFDYAAATYILFHYNYIKNNKKCQNKAPKLDFS